MSKKILGSVNSEQNEQDELDREYINRIKSGDNIALNYIMDKYKNFDSVIVVCHGTLMQYVLGIPHPENGQIEVLAY